MAHFPGNFIRGTAIKLQYRVVLIPWLKWNIGTICCAKRRDYCSSSPVKYIPRNSSKNVENEASSLPMTYLEIRHSGPRLSLERVDISKESSRSFLEVDSKNHDPCLTPDINYELNLEVEEEVEGDFMAVTKEFIEVPDRDVEKISERCHGVQTGHSQQDVEKSAFKLLNSRAFTAMELKKKLKGKRFPDEIIDPVITNFQSRGLLNDGLYAETYSQSRWSSSSWGPRRIKQGLSEKGIKKADADKAIKLVFKNGEGGEDQDSETSISKQSMDQLYVQASKQWQKSHGASTEVRKSRMVRWLQYRGFNWDVIKYVLNKLESRIKYEEDAEKATKPVSKNVEDGEDEDSGASMSKLSMDQLCVQASKQWQRSHGASPEIRKSRMVRWLQYRGFNWDVIKDVLKKLESGDPS